MIVSHRHRFIFVKTRKTASTSIEAFIRPNLSSCDIWTPLSNPEVPGNRYYSLWPFDIAAARSAFVRRKLGKSSPFYFRYLHDHANLGDLYKGYGSRRFSQYFKFCFDRNPWDFAVSLYHHTAKKRGGGKYDFDEFIYTYPIPRNWDQYTIRGEVAVDVVFRYEDLDRQIANVVKKFSLFAGELPRHKSGWRPTTDYRQYYSARTRDQIASQFSGVIEYLKYDF
jgi:hypothetical protein